MKILRLQSAVILIVLLAMGLVQRATAQPNFSFTLEPSSLTLVPGQSASFVVSISPLDGFSNAVTLSATNLPSGVTASFYPQTLTPPGTSLLTLDATTNAANGAFNLELTAAGGGITNTASSSVSVSFGLLPICYGAFQGIVTDTQTGLPLSNVMVSAGGEFATTSASGQYVLTNLSLSSSENLPAYYGVTASESGYWQSTSYAYAVCDATNTVNFQILLEQFGSISGTVTAQGGGPLANVDVEAVYESYYYATTDTNGFFQFESLALGSGNTPVNYGVSMQDSGYWLIETNAFVEGNSNTVLNLVAIPICYVTVMGSVSYANTGQPASNIFVSIGETGATTDSNGNYSATNVTLASDNTPTVVYIEASATGYYAGTTNVAVSNCNQTVGAGTISLLPVPPPPMYNYGSVTGHVYDLQTGLPITNAFVGTYYGSDYTDTNGSFLITNILIGSGAVTNAFNTVYAEPDNYFESASNVTLYANETVTQNLYVVRIGYGYLEGTVLNSATGLPVAGVFVYGDSALTGTNGQYVIGPVQLNPGNVPTYLSTYAEEAGYWLTYTNTTLTNGVTNMVNFQFIQICMGATIVGNVVNALTQQPITNATVSVQSPPYPSVMTDTNGNFILTNITVGNDNTPMATTLNATAPGFNPQSRTLTIFCDATISTEFGAPETAFGAIDGYVTNAVTGQPLTNVFIGSSFGSATYTDTNGFYVLDQAPLGANGASRTWTITAGPVTIGSVTYPAQNKSTVVSSNMTNLLSFGFGQPPTTLEVFASGPTSPVTAGSNLTYTVTLTNLVANAENVSVTDTLPPGVTFVSAVVSNNPDGEFAAPVLTNGMVTITATNFSSNSAVVILITVTPTVAGTLTNVVGVTSTTPEVNPGNTNLTSTTMTTVNSPALFADMGVFMTSAPNPVLVSNQLTYTFLVTNLGPANAPAVVLTDTLPANASFFSASVSQGDYTVIPGGLQWNIGAVNNQGSASATVVILPLATGQITNTASVSITPGTPVVTDTNLANNTAINAATVTALTLTNVSIQFGSIAFNPQTGLYQQTVQFNNLSGVTAAAVRIAVQDLSSTVMLYNATGMTGGVPYVEYDQPVVTGGNVAFLLEYYDSTRQPFVSTNFVATVVAAVIVPTPTGTVLQLDSAPFLSDGQLTIEFASVPGHTYVVQYSSDMLTWLTATPPIVAKNTRTQWIDSGPPTTESLPGSLGQRFYRIVQTN
jgi:uncharacterized repeat protein (TIGR01451 family)